MVNNLQTVEAYEPTLWLMAKFLLFHIKTCLTVDNDKI